MRRKGYNGLSGWFVSLTFSSQGGLAMKTQTHEEPGILAAAERQMHAWAMSHERRPRRPSRSRRPGDAADAEIRGDFARPAPAAAKSAGASANGWVGKSSTKICWIASPIVSISPASCSIWSTRPAPVGFTTCWARGWITSSCRTRSTWPVWRVVLAAARRGPAVFVGRVADRLAAAD